MATATDSYVPTLAGGMPPVDNGRSLQQVRTNYTTALSVQKPRVLSEVETRLLQEADQAGEDFYYGWGAGKDRVEGPSVELSLAAARCYGNCAVEMAPVQETHDAWIFAASFIDLETGFTISRQFRQSKYWTVYGKFDEARKEDIRFQIGQSKAIRNVVLNAVPEWLTKKAMERAKGGVREKIQQTVDKHGIEAVIEKAMEQLSQRGIEESRVLAKFGRPTVRGLTVEDLVLIRGDLSAIDGGRDTVEHLYPPPKSANGDSANDGATADDLLNPQPAKRPRPPAKGKAAAEDSGKAKDEPDQQTPQGDAPEASDEPSDKYLDILANMRGAKSKAALLNIKQALMAAKAQLPANEFAELSTRLEARIKEAKD